MSRPSRGSIVVNLRALNIVLGLRDIHHCEVYNCVTLPPGHSLEIALSPPSSATACSGEGISFELDVYTCKKLLHIRVLHRAYRTDNYLICIMHFHQYYDVSFNDEVKTAPPEDYK